MTQPVEKSLVFRLNENGAGPELIRQVFLEKGWSEFSEDSQDEFDWNAWWRTSRFRNCDYEQLQPWQRLNHFQNTIAITKKDCLARNMKRMKGVYGQSVHNFSPLAFNLPNDYTRFVAEYTKHREKSSKDQYWICKPADLSRGRGIFIFKDLSELQYDCNAVLQKYITNPLLISGYKFDLRIYVLVPSFQPLQIYIYEEGLVRFSTEKYDLSSLRNMFAHLTNTSINKYSPGYTLDKERVGPGCKWTLTQLRHYFRQSNIDDITVWGRIINLIILTLLIQASQVPKTTNCFELYGFDVMIDENLKPWLLEVNFSPALSSDCQTDIVVKKPLLSDIIDMMGFKDVDKERGGAGSQQRQINHAYGTAHNRTSSGMVKFDQKMTSRLPHKPKLTAGSQKSAAEDDDSENEVPVAIVPGCGLPSVQQSLLCRPPSGSVCSSASSDELPRSNKQESGRMNGTNTLRSGATINTNGANKMYNCSPYRTGIYSQMSPERGGKHGKYPLYKKDSKTSVNSDSGVSSYSGSSDNSDTMYAANNPGLDDERRTSLYDPTRRKLSSSVQTNNTTNGNKTSSVKVKFPKTAGTKSFPALQKYKKMSPHIAQSAHVSSRTNNSEPNSKLQQHRHSIANPIIHSDFTKESLRPTQNAQPGKAKPSSRPKQAARKSVEGHPSKTGARSLPSRIGEFVLVFPFSDATKKCSLNNHSTVAVKTVIAECQALLRDRVKVMGGQRSEANESQSLQSQAEAKNIPWLWAPKRDCTATVH